MRKGIFGRQLGRNKNQRQALFRGLVSALVKEGEIETTLAKAKAIQGQAERLVTRAKEGTVANRRVLLRFLTKRDLVNRLVMDIAPLFKEKAGGYLRIVRLGRRRGDAAEMVKLMFVEKISKQKVLKVPQGAEEKK